MSSFTWPASGGGIAKYSTVSALPTNASAGDVAVTLDTNVIYEYTGSAWNPTAGSTVPLAVGTIDTQAPSANAASIASNAIFMQSASGAAPGVVNLVAQTFAGAKTFSGAISAANLSGTNTGDQTITLTGNVTGTGAGSFATTIAPLAVVNSMVSASAGIVYSKLSLTGTIVNADIATGAAITYAKLSLGLSIVNADIATGAAIVYSKLTLTGAVVNADIATGAAIAYSKLSLGTSIVNSDIAAAAAISFSKLATLTAAHVLVGNISGVATDTAITGDISLTNTGLTAYSGVVPLLKGGTGTAAASANAAFNALSPMTALGDTIYGGASGAGTTLAGNITTTKKYLTQTGGGAVSAAPAWSTIAAVDVPTLNQSTTGTASNVTGIVALVNGGTGQTTKAPAFDALQPMTTAGDMIYGGTAGTGTRLPVGSNGKVLQVVAGAPSWVTLSASGQEFYTSAVCNTNSTAITSTTFGTFSNSPTLTFTPTQGGTWKVYCPIRLYSSANVSTVRISNTTGSATLLAESQAGGGGLNPGADVGTNFIQSTYTLSSGTSYSFDIQGKVLAGGQVTAYGATGQFYIFAERMGA